jgi:hypothetical protein
MWETCLEGHILSIGGDALSTWMATGAHVTIEPV